MFGILRTLLAINVVLLHIFNVPALGNYSVSFFFLLSGFLMTYIMHNTYGFNLNGFKVFWYNRFLRLYPIYWVILIATIIGIILFPNVLLHPHMYMPTSIKEWLYNLTMIFPNKVPHHIKPRLISPSWALTNEIVYYVLISLGISKTIWRTLIWLALSIAYYMFTYMYYDIATYRYSAILASSLPFALGACLYWFNFYRPLKNVNIYGVLFSYTLFVVNALYFRELFPLLSELSIYINLLIAFSIVYMLFNLKNSISIKKFDNYIGRFSYPFYLSHYIVLIGFVVIFNIGVQEHTFKLRFDALILYFSCLILFGLFLVHLIDKPIDKIKLLIKRKRLK